MVGGGWRRGGARVYASSSMSGTPFLRVSSRPVLSCALAGSPTQLAGSWKRAAYAPTVDRDGFQPCSLVRDRPLPGPRFICAHSTAAARKPLISSHSTCPGIGKANQVLAYQLQCSLRNLTTPIHAIHHIAPCSPILQTIITAEPSHYPRTTAGSQRPAPGESAQSSR